MLPIGKATSRPFSLTCTNLLPGTYTVVAKAMDNHGMTANSAPVTFRVAPFNDDFANRMPLFGGYVTGPGINVGASKEPGEPDHAGNRGGHSVWWSWFAGANGPVTISVDSRTADWHMYPLLAIYTGSSLANLDQVASFMPDYENYAQVTFNAVKGATYYIAVDGAWGNYGKFTLTISQAAGSPLR